MTKDDIPLLAVLTKMAELHGRLIRLRIARQEAAARRVLTLVRGTSK